MANTALPFLRNALILRIRARSRSIYHLSQNRGMLGREQFAKVPNEMMLGLGVALGEALHVFASEELKLHVRKAPAASVFQPRLLDYSSIRTGTFSTYDFFGPVNDSM